jgi:hypothetical protein
MEYNISDANFLIAQKIYNYRNVYMVYCKECKFGSFPDIILKKKDIASSVKIPAQLVNNISAEDYHDTYLSKSLSLKNSRDKFLNESLIYDNYYAGSFQILPDYIININNFNEMIKDINSNSNIKDISYNTDNKNQLNQNLNYRYRVISSYLNQM